MSILPGAWRVVGITPLAHEELSKTGFLKSKDCKIQRAHLRPRNERIRELLQRDHPMSEQELVRYWRHNDRTVLVAQRREQKAGAVLHSDL